ncbi:zinc ABC transporter permease AztB [Pseudonocardia acaciae]|uniref:zinc ABC transporter permease AztB n=1 Tax=Pseudonocardia acaciae TaxID=551276 RepID=UPI0005606F04|nr:zinc ABC transporter permease AztB [Pseudonocardia acaciae]
MEAWFEPFAIAFMQRALLAGVLTAVMGALVGTWVVLRGLTLMGEALSHGVLPGLAAAALLGVPLALGAAVGAVAMVAGIDAVHRGTRFSRDVGIALLLVGMLALGVVLVSGMDSFAVNLTDFLFGDPLGVGPADLVAAAVAAVVALAVVALGYRPFLVLAFDEERARLLGLAPRLTHGVQLALIAMVITVSYQVVGTLLVFGLLVAPPATAALLVRRVVPMMALAAALGCLAVWLGLLVSFHAGTAAGATMAAASVAMFFLVLAVRQLTGTRSR